MSDYISREAVTELIRNYGKGAISDGQKTLDPVDDIITLVKGLDLIPAADVAEVRRGEWIAETERQGNYSHCSKCGCRCAGYTPNYNYCPNCGARMDGD